MQNRAISLLAACFATAMLMPCGCSAAPTVKYASPTVREFYSTTERPTETSYKVMADEIQVQDEHRTVNYPHAIAYRNEDINREVADDFVCVLYLTSDGDLRYRYQTYGKQSKTHEDVLMSAQLVDMELIDGHLIVMDANKEVYFFGDYNDGIFAIDKYAAHFRPVDTDISLNQIATDLQDAEYKLRWMDTEKYIITEAAIKV